MGRAVPETDAADGSLAPLGTLAVQGADPGTTPLLRALAARGRLRVQSWPPSGAPERERPGQSSGASPAESHAAPVALLVCDGLSPAQLLGAVPLLSVSTQVADDMPGKLWSRIHRGAWSATRARAFQGFITPGWLGVQQLLSLGVPRERIAVGWGALDAEAWRAKVGPLRPGRGKRRTALVAADASAATESERESAEAVVRALEKTVRVVPVAEADARAFAAADVFVQLGTRDAWSEPLLRAALVGLPLVSSSHGRAADLVLPDRTGRLLSALDPAEAVEAVHAALALPRARLTATLRLRTRALEAARAALELERLVESLRTPLPWRPLHRVVDDLLRNPLGMGPSVKVAIVSDFNPRFPHGLEGSYARAFEQTGHTVFPISLHSLFSLPVKLGRFAGYVGPVVGQARVLEAVREAAADLVVLVKAMGVLESTVRALRSDGARVVNVFPDNPFDAMAVNPLGGLLLTQLRALHAVFVHDRFAVAQLRRLGIAAHFLAFARDPQIQDRRAWDGSGPIRSDASADVIFVGNPDSERLRYLRAVQDLGLGLWGNWHLARLDADDPLSGCVRGGELTGAEMVRTLHAGKLSLNILRGSQKTAHNMRTFESPACGVCTLSEASPGVLELMEDGKEVVSFASPLELRERVQWLLAHRKEREAIAQAGWKRVELDCYRERVDTLLQS